MAVSLKSTLDAAPWRVASVEHTMAGRGRFITRIGMEVAT
jgi:hypothetical protein